MSVTGADIRVQAAPNPWRAFVLAAVVLTALAAGIVIGRQTTSVPQAAPAAVAETAISTRWLDDTPAVRTEIMRAMNALPAASRWLDTSSTAAAVARHMNELSAAQATARGAATTAHVVRYLIELAPRTAR